MPRAAREVSPTGIYHVIERGINRQDIFQQDEDKDAYFDRLLRYKRDSDFEIYAYCLMSNHVHLLVKENSEPLAAIMKKIGASYAHWYNQKYGRIGHLFQDRYKSEVVKDDAYLLTAVRYILQNPVKNGRDIADWTNYNDYISGNGATDIGFILGMFDDDTDAFKRYVSAENEDKLMDIEEKARLTDEHLKEIILGVTKLPNWQALQMAEKNVQRNILLKLLEAGASYRQIERVTGIGRGVVQKVR